MRSQWKRRVIPRWRSSGVSAGLLENLPVKAVVRRARVDYGEQVTTEVAKQVAAWQIAPSLGIAADLLNFAHIKNVRTLLKEPALYVRQHAENLSPQIRVVANRVLGDSFFSEYASVSLHQKEIIKLKSQLRVNPRNAIALVDMARLYAIKAQRQHADRAIRTAVALQPDNRFVLRSASRFYVHDGDPEHALSILTRSSRTREDPWLLASMVAIETIQGRSPVYFKRARAMMENPRFAAAHLAELGAALATLQLNTGHLKNARRLFTISLANPNDNAVAQAVWAANEFSMPMNIRPEWLEGQFSSEANYYTLERAGNYEMALAAAQKWFDDEPFSVRPLQAGCFAASILGMYELAEDLVRQALLIDPGSTNAKNNLVFALAGQNKIIEAIQFLNEVIAAEVRLKKHVSGHTYANCGMVYYRTGEVEQGRKHYDLALKALEKEKKSSMKMIAAAFWAQEATRAEDPTLDLILARVVDDVTRSDSVAAKLVLNRISDDKVAPIDTSKKIYRPGLLWDHDRTSNSLIARRKDPFSN